MPRPSLGRQSWLAWKLRPARLGATLLAVACPLRCPRLASVAPVEVLEASIDTLSWLCEGHHQELAKAQLLQPTPSVPTRRDTQGCMDPGVTFSTVHAGVWRGG